MKSILRKALTVCALSLVTGLHAQDTLWKDDGISLNLGGWVGAGSGESMEGPVNYASLGLGFHADNYQLGIGFVRGNAREDVTNGGYFATRFEAGESIIDAEYDFGKGTFGESQTVSNLTVQGFIYSDRTTITHKAHIGYWRSINGSVFYWGGQCMFLTGERVFASGGTAATSTIDDHIVSKTLNGGAGISVFAWHPVGLMFSGSMVFGADGSRYQRDYEEVDRQSGDTIKEIHENVKSPIGFYFSLRLSVGWLIGRTPK